MTLFGSCRRIFQTDSGIFWGGIYISEVRISDFWAPLGMLAALEALIWTLEAMNLALEAMIAGGMGRFWVLMTMFGTAEVMKMTLAPLGLTSEAMTSVFTTMNATHLTINGAGTPYVSTTPNADKPFLCADKPNPSAITQSPNADKSHPNADESNPNADEPNPNANKPPHIEKRKLRPPVLSLAF